MAIDPTQEMRQAFLDAGTLRGYGGQLEDEAAGIAAVLAIVERDYELIPRRPDRVCGAEGPAGETCLDDPDHEADDHSGTVTMPSTWR